MANLTDLTGQNITTTATATYAENINAGQNVKLNSSGELAVWGVGEFASSLTRTEVKTSYTGTASNYRLTTYAKNRSILFVAEEGGQQIFAVERNNLNTATVTLEQTLSDPAEIDHILYLDDANKLLVFYWDNTGNNIEIYSYDYSNGTFTLDGSSVFAPAGSPGNIIFPRSVPGLIKNSQGQDVAVFPYYVPSGGSAGGGAAFVRYNNGALDTSSSSLSTTATDAEYLQVVYDSTNSKAIFTYTNGSPDDLHCKTATLSNLTPTFSTEVSESYGINFLSDAYTLVFDSLRGKAIAIGTRGTELNYIVIDASPATPTLTTLATASITAISSNTFNQASVKMAFDPLTNKSVLIGVDNTTNDDLYCFACSLSASDVLTVEENLINNSISIEDGGATITPVVFYDPSYQSISISYGEETSLDYQISIGRLNGPGALVDFTPDQDKLIGVALDTKITGQFGKYRLLDKYKGVLVKNLTGLVPGAEYYINAVGGLTTSITSDFYGLAISSSQAITSTVLGLLTELKKLTIGEGRVINSYTGSDNTNSGTYTTICDQGGSGVLKSITCSSSNVLAAVALRLTVNGVETVLFGSIDANPLHGHNANESATWECDIPYQGGIKVEVDSSNAGYTTNCTVILHQD